MLVFGVLLGAPFFSVFLCVFVFFASIFLALVGTSVFGFGLLLGGHDVLIHQLIDSWRSSPGRSFSLTGPGFQFGWGVKEISLQGPNKEFLWFNIGY